MTKRALLFRKHAIQRMFERRISEEAVRSTVVAGEVIQEYPDDTPYPSRLILGWDENRAIHVVAACDEQTQTDIIITVYEPDPSQWEPGFKRRKMS